MAPHETPLQLCLCGRLQLILGTSQRICTWGAAAWSEAILCRCVCTALCPGWRGQHCVCRYGKEALQSGCRPQ